MQVSLGDRDSITVLNSAESNTMLLDLDSTSKAFKDELDARLTKYVKSSQQIAVSPKGKKLDIKMNRFAYKHHLK
jgi:hypothetical protein